MRTRTAPLRIVLHRQIRRGWRRSLRTDHWVVVVETIIDENDWRRRGAARHRDDEGAYRSLTLTGLRFSPVLPPDLAEVPLHQALEYSHPCSTPRSTTPQGNRQTWRGSQAYLLRRWWATACGGAVAWRTYVEHSDVRFNSPRADRRRRGTFAGQLGQATIVSDWAAATSAGRRDRDRPETSGSNPPGQPDPALYSISYHDQRTAQRL